MQTPLLHPLFPILFVALTLPSNTNGGDAERNADAGISNSAARVAELFEAMDEDLINVRFIPQNAAKANILLRNNSDQPVLLELPTAFAAVPMLAQFGPNGGGQNFAALDGLAAGGQGGRGATQGVGGGFNAGQGQGQALGPGMQFGGPMRIPPGKTRKLTATTVCLEHGKPEPNPRLAYRMLPIEQFTDDQRLAQLCAQLGRGVIKQNSAQAAAWYLANGLNWKHLATINRLESRYLGNVPFFSSAEIEQAKSLVAALADQHEPDDTSLQSDSTSRNR